MHARKMYDRGFQVGTKRKRTALTVDTFSDVLREFIYASRSARDGVGRTSAPRKKCWRIGIMRCVVSARCITSLIHLKTVPPLGPVDVAPTFRSSVCCVTSSGVRNQNTDMAHVFTLLVLHKVVSFLKRKRA